MAYDSIISRTDAAALLPETVSNELLGGLDQYSAAYNVFRRINVSSKQVRFPVLSAFPIAYWVDGDTGLKQTTEVAWSNKYLTVEKLAAIVPVPDSVIQDASFDSWGQIQPLVRTAIGRGV